MTDWKKDREVIEAATPGPWSDYCSDKWGMFWHVGAPEHEDLKRSDGSFGHIAIEMRSGLNITIAEGDSGDYNQRDK